MGAALIDRVSREASGRFALDRGAKGLQPDGDRVLTTQGPVIQNGHTAGHSNELRIRVRHGPSFWRAGTRVYRLEF
jgi:hypothetical protein